MNLELFFDIAMLSSEVWLIFEFVGILSS